MTDGVHRLSVTVAKLPDPQRIAEIQPDSQNLHDIQSNHQNLSVTESSGHDPGSSSIAESKNKKVSREDIELVQNLIERCLQLYMNKGEVVKTLSSRARIEPGFTALVWQKLEEENSEFFRAYYIRLKLKKQIILFNQLLEHQYHLMKCPILPNVPLAPMQNGTDTVHVNSLAMGYSVFQSQTPTTGQLHVDPMGCGLSSSHVVNGYPAPGNFHPNHRNTGNGIVMDSSTTEEAPSVPQCNAMLSMSEMAMSSASAASSNHFPFTPSEIPTEWTHQYLIQPSHQIGGLQLGADGVASSRDSIRSSGQLWNFSFSDLTADLTNLEDLGALGDYTGSPFLPSDSDILLDSPNQNDIVEEFFADSITGTCLQSDEDK
ncbi:hypothetical protein MUK42_03294 [Musa troglodytarum]|uniref:Uncharacterized protein n=1 Tax=Musa troglodytarum TaxID=320322 RepID=A0A9E7GYY6_9LILI|nr:hypothetical protein MUK42_03294 [Musa troglodytarum]